MMLSDNLLLQRIVLLDVKTIQVHVLLSATLKIHDFIQY